MKKFIAVLTVFCIALTMLTGCVGVNKKDPGNETGKEKEVIKKEDVDKAIDTLEDSGVSLDPDLKDLIDDIDQEDIDAAAAANADIKVTADLPEGWVRDEEAVVPFSAKSGMNMVMVTAVIMSSSDPLKAAEEAAEQTKKYFEDAKFSPVESMKLSDYDGAGYSIEISITSSFVQTQEYFYFSKDGRLFMVQGAYMADDEAGAAEVRKVMDSIKVE